MVAGGLVQRTFFYQNYAPVLSTTTNAPTITALSITAAVPPNAVAIVQGSLAITANGSQSANGTTDIAIYPESVGVSTTAIGLGVAIANTTAQNWAVTIGPLAITTPQTMYYSTAGINTNVNAQIAISAYMW
jgi:hypothetical protein